MGLYFGNNAIGSMQVADIKHTHDVSDIIDLKTPNLDISLKEFVEGTIEEFKSDYVETVEAYSFYKLTSLKKVVLNSAKKIEKNAFNGCTALETLVLGNETEICTLENTNALTGTLFASGTGSIYVPVHLLTAYKEDEMWSTYVSCFKTFGEVEKIVSGKKLHLYSEEITTINSQVFNFDDTVESIDFPNCVTIGTNAFSNNKGLKRITLTGMTELTNVISPDNCEEINMPNLTKVCNYAFDNCKSVKYLSFPFLTETGTRGNTFSFCSSLISIDLPLVTTFYGAEFHTCSALKEVNIPKVTNIPAACFYKCTSLETLDLPSVTTFSSTSCERSALKTLILRNTETVCSLTGSSSYSTPFKNTAFGNGGSGGVVLVPSALIEGYNTATDDWATVISYGTCTFLPLEEYTVDGTTTGEIDWDKLNARESA